MTNDFTGFDSTQTKLHHEIEKSFYKDYLRDVSPIHKEAFDLYMKSLEKTKGTIMMRENKDK